MHVMNYNILLLSALLFFTACSNEQPTDHTSGKAEARLEKLKKQRADIEQEIKSLEASLNKTGAGKITPVSISTLETGPFRAYIDIQAQVTGDENVLATPQAPGVVTRVYVKSGQKVQKGQALAALDAAALELQIKSMDAQLTLTKQLYEKQQKLWAQNIGTEVQLLQAKAQYESLESQRASLNAQKEMHRIISPINGVVDEVGIKEGDIASPGMSGIRVVGKDKLKVTANLGENYLGKVTEGDPVMLIFNNGTDSLHTRLSYVARSVNPVSRAFHVEVKLSSDTRLHPNMSCKMKIANYENPEAIAIPISVVQRTADGEIVYIADKDQARLVPVQLGKISHGLVEITSGLNPGDQLITAGFEDLNNGSKIQIQ